MNLRIKKNIEIPSMRVWSQTAHFSFLYVERSQNQDEENYKFIPGFWNWIKERRFWKEKFWITTQDENKARILVEDYLTQKVNKLKSLKNFKFKLKKDFQLTEKRALGICPTIHSKPISVQTKCLVEQ